MVEEEEIVVDEVDMGKIEREDNHGVRIGEVETEVDGRTEEKIIEVDGKIEEKTKEVDTEDVVEEDLVDQSMMLKPLEKWEMIAVMELEVSKDKIEISKEEITTLQVVIPQGTKMQKRSTLTD